MTYRLESIATHACRQLVGRSQSSSSSSSSTLRRLSLLTKSGTRITLSPLQQINTASCTRPTTATIPPFYMNNNNIGSQYRLFHLTSTVRNTGSGGEAAAAAPATAVNNNNNAPFASPKVEALFQKILWLDMVEVHLLAELINEKLGITISDAERERMARGGGGGGKKGGAGADDAPVEAVQEEKTVFDIKLTGFDAKNKIKVIKEVRAMTNLGLKEAKELVEGVPAMLKKNIKKEEAEELKAKLAELGAQVDIV